MEGRGRFTGAVVDGSERKKPREWWPDDSMRAAEDIALKDTTWAP